MHARALAQLAIATAVRCGTANDCMSSLPLDDDEAPPPPPPPPASRWRIPTPTAASEAPAAAALPASAVAPAPATAPAAETTERFWQARCTATVRVTRDEEGRKVVNEYVILGRLGAGAFGTVKLCERFVPGHPSRRFALKVFNKLLLRKRKEYRQTASGMVACPALERVQHEVEVMRTLYHPNIALLFEVMDAPDCDKLYLVLEYMDLGALMTWDPDSMRFRAAAGADGVAAGGAFTAAAACRHFVAMASALLYLHRRGIAHRDVKPQNMLLNSDGKCRLSDFGVACQLAAGERLVTDTQGTHAFLAPECCRGGAYDPMLADVWSLGVSLHCCLYGALPFWAEGANPLFEAIMHAPLELPAHPQVDGAARDLLRALLSRDPAERPALESVLQHEWVVRHSSAMQ